MRKTLTALSMTLVLAGAANAQEDGSQIILPVEAQTCDLPSAPPRIPEEATYDDLVTAKARVDEFQEALMDYRACLESAGEPEALTQGNHIALNQAHNYSVEMEERVAEQFNIAVRAYKARQEGDG